MGVVRAGRRGDLAVAGDARAADIRRLIGTEVKASRLARHWSQADLGDLAGISRQLVHRVEASDLGVSLEDLARASEAIGRPLRLVLRRDAGLVTDAAHLAMQELVLRTARSAQFDGSFEVPIGVAEPWRSIDVGLSSERLRAMVAAECWNVIGDVGAASRASTRKLAEVEARAAARWGADGRSGLVWVVRATAANRALVARYPEVFAARFPGSSSAWIATLTTGAPLPDGPGLVWCDLDATRLFAWRRAAR